MSIPEFVSELRAAVGPSHLLWLPGINAVVINDEGQVLLQRRSEDSCWSILSGIVEPGEHPVAAVYREVHEETGVSVEVEKLTSITISPIRHHANGDVAQYLEMTFRCRCAVGSAAARVNDDESEAINWFPPDTLPEMDDLIRARVRHAVSGSDEVMYTDSSGLPVQLAPAAHTATSAPNHAAAQGLSPR
ncbi:NUDIX hydrolase [Nocardia transvalensis]|uniref:NUDIX hydrolase n=1 Tax=Nocardia transvalensis TaxID=37333 RepID=UPI001895EBFA|nr:NUDIX domain-containing protein [Nocardia transvalensis]